MYFYNFGEGNKTAQFGSFCILSICWAWLPGFSHFAFVTSVIDIRPSKLDCLFSAMAILLLHAGGQFIFIIHCHFLPFPNQFGEP